MVSWLKDAVIYQVYPTSFRDSDGDGIGDLRGILEKLDYIKDLGVNTIWLNPFYVSPFMDGGYDVADYCDVDKKFGTMTDFEALMAGCKARGLRVIIDFVIGHTSDKHPWFLASAKDEQNEYTGRYIWTDSNFTKYADKSIHGLYPRDGGYVSNYYACQPALNYGFNRIDEVKESKDAYDGGENWKMHYKDERLKPLRDDLLDIMRFWLQKGVDGFRVDMANSLVKGCDFRSDKDEDIEGLIWLWNILIGTIKSEYPDAAFLAEWGSPSNAVGKCGFDVDYLMHENSAYNGLFRFEKDTNILPAFEEGYNYFSAAGKGSVDPFVKQSDDLYRVLDGKGYFTIPSGYHDIIRLGEKKDEETLKVIFAFLLTYKHVPLIYYGDEVGMTHMYGINKDGGYIRTGCRTPMQWNAEDGVGFSSAAEGDCYLPPRKDAERNVAAMEARSDSLLRTIQRLLELRKTHSAFNADAELRVLQCKNGGYPFVYERRNAEEAFTIIIGPSAEEKRVAVPCGNLVLSQNCELRDGALILHGKSFAILKNE